MLPFWWKTIQKTITIAKMTRRPPIRFQVGNVVDGHLLGHGQDVFGQLDRPGVVDRLLAIAVSQVPIEIR